MIYPNPYELIGTMLNESNKRLNAKYSKEEREELNRKMEQHREEEARKCLIHQSICPSCNAKLIRGKKDKRNEYKRKWECTACDTTHYA